MSLQEQLRYLVIRTVGNFLLLFSIFGIFATFGPDIYYEFIYFLNEKRGIHYVVSSEKTQTYAPKDALGFSSIVNDSKESVLMPKDTNFSILIPKIGASSVVFPNVNPENESEYVDILKRGVAHAKGTVFPGMDGIVYIFAHSTDNFWDVGRYNAIFYLLKNLSLGDSVVIFFENTRYNYKVTNVKIVNAEDVSYLNKGTSKKPQLILQTCWPPGTAWKRLIVVAEPQNGN